MLMRTLANGLKIPAVGYGTFPLKEELVRSVPLALGSGFRLIDTSDNYLNEEFVGQGLAACGASMAETVIVTKFSSPRKTKDMSHRFDVSRRRLGGRIDAYLLHWPYPFLWRWQWRQMEDLYLAGRCKAIGVCNFDKAMLQRILKSCRVKPMIDQFERHPLFQQRETADFCRAEGIQVMSYSPFARMDARLMKNPVLLEIAAAHGKTVGQVILRWNVEHGDVPIPASKSECHIRENLDIFDFTLSAEEISRIDALDAGVRVRFDPRRRFTCFQKLKFLCVRMKGAIGHA